MTESDIFYTTTAPGYSAGGFCEPLLLKTTSHARLYRVSKAGKYFVIKTTKDNSEADRAMLRREYDLSIGCDHPHIIHIYTYEEQTPVGEGIVMEYVEGRTMAEWLAENPAKESRRRIFGELLSAVGYMHRRGVLHNDLKPDNILITRADDTLKIIDFGLSDNAAYYLVRTPGCTPCYASPELRGRRPLDARSDIYAVGVIMSELFGGAYRRIVQRCTRTNPDDRYSDMTQLQAAWANRHRVLRIAVAAVVAAMTVLPTALFVRGHRQRTAVELAAAQHKARQNRIIESVESEAARIYRIAADSIAASRFSPFAFRHLYNYTEEFQEFRNACCDSIADSYLKDALTARLIRIAESDYQRLYKAVNLLPDYKAVCTDDEISFYNELIINNKPFRPYPASH